MSLRGACLVAALLLAAPWAARAAGEASPGLRYGPGKFARGAVLNRPGDRVTFALDRPVAARAGTLSLWLRLAEDAADLPPYAPIAALESARGEPLLVLQWAPPDGVEVRAGEEPMLRREHLRPLDWTAGSLHHLAVRWDERGATLFVDGEAQDGGFWSRLWERLFGDGRPLPDFSASRLALGSFADGPLAHLPAGATLDEVRLSDRALEGGEIEDDASAGAPGAAGEGTVLLAHLDGEPPPPMALDIARPLHRFGIGEELAPAAAAALPPIGAAPILAELRWRCRDAAGNVLVDRGRKVTVEPGPAARLPIHLGAAETPGVVRIELELRGPEGATLARGKDFYWIDGDIAAALGEEPAAPSSEPTLGAGIPLAPRFIPNEAIAALGALGVRVLKVPAGWADVERTPGGRDWSALDRVVEEARKAGVGLVLTLVRPADARSDLAGPPAWAVAGGALDEKALGAFAQAAVLRYGEAVRWWQLWQRPEAPSGVSPDAAARLQRALAALVRGGGRALLSPGLGDGGRWLAEFLVLGGAEGVDVWDFQPTSSASDGAAPGAPSLRGGLDGFSGMLSAADAARPIWVTEIAYGREAGADAQAARMAKAFAEALAAPGVAKALWANAWGGGADRLLDWRARPEAALGAFTVLLQTLDGAAYAGPSGYDPGAVRARVFERGGRQATLLWSEGAPARILAPERKRGPGWFVRVAFAGGPAARGVLLGTEIEVGEDPVMVVERADKPVPEAGEAPGETP